MNKEQQKMIATIVKEKRINLNYTQKELAEISNISLRSIQRIEKGEVTPRMHTLKILSNNLNFSLDFLKNSDNCISVQKEISFYREFIFSILIISTTLLLATAYIAQSSTFPETDFELCIYYLVVITALSFILLRLWKNKAISRISNSSYKNL
ncbi:helix-turn-helix domain-containing protein [Chondrinema litorale]|uniref:helix-turn-helix domain-containing protein n=1 Tax=Chondrinema litorale TaxID=2994555 RepID=UPI0025429E18|nr:helix-turn-helix transcriptional regulator [Chondrinema litorale]UZR99139.1 helix-turn-helix transcriptional regulator [Chondrinema litorale]